MDDLTKKHTISTNRVLINFSDENVKELFELCNLIIDHFKPEEYYYLGLGGSPCLVIAGLQVLCNDDTSGELIPFSIKDDLIDNRLLLNQHFDNYRIKLIQKKILLIDSSMFGKTLVRAHDEFTYYLGQKKTLEILSLCKRLHYIKKNFSKNGKSPFFIFLKNDPYRINLYSIIAGEYQKGMRAYPKLEHGEIPDTRPSRLAWLSAKQLIKAKFTALKNEGYSPEFDLKIESSDDMS
ncbi:hypothetical protein [Pelagibaculum spongiae]|uniref:Uncharacterized protein n=1 Tax=Pelagibaculum spongiae TaxID=2080658 RepID=A0A2V1GTZ1_9GAMM|nr:hypothetical protein [Pelagibaculum spongiae]PVZ68127.1 hypothetical protein DC094_12535 [Pelagibaculum spongiae]